MLACRFTVFDLLQVLAFFAAELPPPNDMLEISDVFFLKRIFLKAAE